MNKLLSERQLADNRQFLLLEAAWILELKRQAKTRILQSAVPKLKMHSQLVREKIPRAGL